MVSWALFSVSQRTDQPFPSGLESVMKRLFWSAAPPPFSARSWAPQLAVPAMLARSEPPVEMWTRWSPPERFRSQRLACWRLTGSFGWKVPSGNPEAMPCAASHPTSSWKAELVGTSPNWWLARALDPQAPIPKRAPAARVSMSFRSMVMPRSCARSEGVSPSRSAPAAGATRCRRRDAHRPDRHGRVDMGIGRRLPAHRPDRVALGVRVGDEHVGLVRGAAPADRPLVVAAGGGAVDGVHVGQRGVVLDEVEARRE